MRLQPVIKAKRLQVSRGRGGHGGGGHKGGGGLGTHRLGEGATDGCRHTLPLSCCLSFLLPYSLGLGSIIPDEPVASLPICAHACLDNMGKGCLGPGGGREGAGTTAGLGGGGGCVKGG